MTFLGKNISDDISEKRRIFWSRFTGNKAYSGLTFSSERAMPKSSLAKTFADDDYFMKNALNHY